MSKSSYIGANVEVNIDSFASFINKVNWIIDDMGKTVVTAAPVAEANATNGSMTTGNAHIQGILSSNVVVAQELRGGNFQSSNNIALSSNVVPKANTVVSLGVTSNRINNVNAANTNTLNLIANNATITTGNVVTLTSNNATVTTGEVVSLTSNNAVITTGNVVTLTSNSATIVTGNVANLTSANATMTLARITTANVTTANVATAYIGAGTATLSSANVATLTSNNTTITTGNVANLSSANATFTVARITTANVTTANVATAFVANAQLTSATVVNETVTTGNVANLTSANANITKLTISGNTDTQNVVIHGNLTVEGITALASNNALAVNTAINTTLTVLSQANLNGNTNIGDATTDIVNITARLNSDLVPSGNGAVDIGATGNRFSTAYINNIGNNLTVKGTMFVENTLTANAGINSTGSINIQNDGPILRFVEDDTNTQSRIILSGGITYFQIGAANTGANATSGSMIFTGGSSVTTDIGTFAVRHSGQVRNIWHAGNMGSGSTLDADLLDGQHGAYYLNIANATGTLNSARLVGDYSFANLTLSGNINTSTINSANGQQVIINAGESGNFATGQTAEQVYINAKTGLAVTSSIDNWATGWAGRKTSVISGTAIVIDGNTVWHQGNDGSGTGLDADLLDGQHGTYYRDLTNSTGTLPNARLSGAYDGITLSSTSVKVASAVWSTTVPLAGGLTVEGVTPLLYYRQTDSGASALTGVNGNSFYLLGADDNSGTYTRQVLNVPLLGTGNMLYNGDTVWTAGNDGASSGLDSDLLDGQHGSYYLSASNMNAGTLPSARISGSYTGITGVGTLAAGSISSTFGNINIGTATFTGNGSGITSLNASNLSSGTLPNARISGSYDGIDTLTANRIRLLSTSDMSDTSTAHGFQIGPDSGRNVRLDTNEFMLTNNGVRASDTYFFNINDVSFTGDLACSGIGSFATLWVGGEDVATKSTQIIAGNGLTGGGTLFSDRTIALGTPGTLSGTTTNSVTSTSHTHDVNVTSVASLGNAGLGIGAVGTYAFLWNTVSEALNPGTTRAGSTLEYSNANGQTGGTSPGGTWRLMGCCFTGSGSPRSSVWLRIS